MITARLIRNVLLRELPVPHRVVTRVLLVCIALAMATYWMAMQP
jgi:hypothetical protein